MRALCGAPGAARPRPLPPAARFLSLRAPPGAAPLRLLLDAKARVRDLRAHVTTHLRLHGVLDTALFGVAVLCGGDFLFPDPDSKLAKYAPKSWRASHTHGLDANGRPLLELHVRVQFYVESPQLLRDPGARRLYVRLLREHAERAPLQPAVRARLQAAEPERAFLREACALHTLSAHCYRLRAHRREPEPGSVRLFVRAGGLTVAPDARPPASFPWPSIGKLRFDRKKFEIRAGESRITLYSSGDEKSELLLALCRETHQFSMRTAEPADARRRDGDAEDVEDAEEASTFERAAEVTLPRVGESEQRVSVSSASSNTTSGIVSDRVQSEDEPEIMIDCPPAPIPGESTRDSRRSSSGSTVVAPDPRATPAPSSETSGVYTMTGDGSAPYDLYPPAVRGRSYRVGGDSSVSRDSDGRPAAASDCASFYNDGSFTSGDSTDGGPRTVPAFRERADSGASGAGSFRGDGSDPTDRRHGPLSAEELSDLIVGRAGYPPAPPPDEESDYVTLPRPGHYPLAPPDPGFPGPGRYSPPLPPAPPERLDSVTAYRPSTSSIVDTVDAIDGRGPVAPFGPPPPYEPGAGSLRELRLGIPVREPPPYPGRACPARFPPHRLPSAFSPAPEPPRPAPRPVPPPLTVYASQLARSQIEQYRRQLYSDVDYVVYPLQDPAVSHRDYLDSKVAAACPRGSPCRGGSGQALSDTYVRLPPCAAPPRREPPPPPLGRTVSEDSILDSLGRAPRRLPPPPPRPRRPPPREPAPLVPPEAPRPPDAAGPIDIKTLREKSRNLDLPLIAALCNDRSLLKQTKAFVMPRHGERAEASRRAALGGKAVRRGCHRHPGDALPALPATANTYVPDPRAPTLA